MEKYLITELLDGPGSKCLYREFIQEQTKNLSKVKLENAIERETSNLPENLRDEVEGYILLTNLQLGHDKKNAGWVFETRKRQVHHIQV